MKEVVSALLAKRAEVHGTSSGDGETPLRYGTSGFSEMKDLKPEIRIMLEEAGAK